jgi:hypothetical protein
MKSRMTMNDAKKQIIDAAIFYAGVFAILVSCEVLFFVRFA